MESARQQIRVIAQMQCNVIVYKLVVTMGSFYVTTTTTTLFVPNIIWVNGTEIHGSMEQKFIGKFLKNARVVEFFGDSESKICTLKILARSCGKFGYVMILSSS